MNLIAEMMAQGPQPTEEVGTVSALVLEPEKIQDAPTEPDKLAKQWQKRIDKAKQHWKAFYKRCEYNRNLVANYDWKADGPQNAVKKSVNQALAGIATLLPSLYSKNPEISVTPTRKGDIGSHRYDLFCETLETVINAHFKKAKLKQRGKGVVRAALTCSYGVLKVVYQRDIDTDPVIHARLKDAQDNLARIDALLSAVQDDEQRSSLEAERMELAETIEGYQSGCEPEKLDGLVIDRLLTEHVIIDPDTVDFDDIDSAAWMCQCIPMSREFVEQTYKVKINGAAVYSDERKIESKALGANPGDREQENDDDRVMVFEIWDARAQRVYTMVDGCPFFIREPYTPIKVGNRWFPFFFLTFSQVDGKVIAPSFVDLIEQLQEEHNDIRTREREHRDICKPGWITSASVEKKDIDQFAISGIGDIVVLKSDEGEDIRAKFIPKQYPPIDASLYDTTHIRQDFEEVGGLQDAMRSTFVKAKTATEANIMQESLSSRTAAFRDSVEDFLQDIAQYTAAILLNELDETHVAEIMGEHQQITDQMGMVVGVEPAYAWPQLTNEKLARMVEVKIEAGSTGSPNKQVEQENWQKVLPQVLQLEQLVYQYKMQGIDTNPLEILLRETVRRFDDRLDPESLIPDLTQFLQQQAQAQQQQAMMEQAAQMQQQPM